MNDPGTAVNDTPRMDEKRLLLSTPEYVAAIREAIYLLRWWPTADGAFGGETAVNFDRSIVTVDKLVALLRWLDVPEAELVDDEAVRRRILKREAKRRQAARARGLDVPKRPPGWKAKPFWSYVDKATTPDGCWTWTGCLRRGYGDFKHGGRKYGAHVWSWRLANGREVPTGLCVMHKCDNRACVRPDHLQVGTTHENMLDKVQKGRQARGESNASSKLTEDRVRYLKKNRPKGRELTALARIWGVSATAVREVLLGRNWRHIEVAERG